MHVMPPVLCLCLLLWGLGAVWGASEPRCCPQPRWDTEDDVQTSSPSRKMGVSCLNYKKGSTIRLPPALFPLGFTAVWMGQGCGGRGLLLSRIHWSFLQFWEQNYQHAVPIIIHFRQMYSFPYIQVNGKHSVVNMTRLFRKKYMPLTG